MDYRVVLVSIYCLVHSCIHWEWILTHQLYLICGRRFLKINLFIFLIAFCELKFVVTCFNILILLASFLLCMLMSEVYYWGKCWHDIVRLGIKVRWLKNGLHPIFFLLFWNNFCDLGITCALKLKSARRVYNQEFFSGI